MAEIIGTAIGVVGLLGQLFDGCVKAYGYFTTAVHLDQESQRLLCKVRIEEMRLVVWGREWGVAEGKLEAHLKTESNPRLRQLALQIMTELHNTVTDFQRLQEKYGLSQGDGAAFAAGQVQQQQQQQQAAGKTVDGKTGENVGGQQTGERTVGVGGAGPAPSPVRKGSDQGSKSHTRRNSKNTNGGNGGGGGGTEKTGFSWKRELTLRAKWVIAGRRNSKLSSSPRQDLPIPWKLASCGSGGIGLMIPLVGICALGPESMSPL
jgi:hypothetical protein